MTEVHMGVSGFSAHRSAMASGTPTYFHFRDGQS